MAAQFGMAFDHPELPRIIAVHSLASSQSQGLDYCNDSQGCISQVGTSLSGAQLGNNSASILGQNGTVKNGYGQAQQDTLSSNNSLIPQRLKWRRSRTLRGMEPVATATIRDVMRSRYATMTGKDMRNDFSWSSADRNKSISNRAGYYSEYEWSKLQYAHYVKQIQTYFDGIVEEQQSRDVFSGNEKHRELFSNLLIGCKKIDWARVYDGARLLLRPLFEAKLPVTRSKLFEVIFNVLRWLYGPKPSQGSCSQTTVQVVPESGKEATVQRGTNVEHSQPPPKTHDKVVVDSGRKKNVDTCDIILSPNVITDEALDAEVPLTRGDLTESDNAINYSIGISQRGSSLFEELLSLEERRDLVEYVQSEASVSDLVEGACSPEATVKLETLEVLNCQCAVEGNLKQQEHQCGDGHNFRRLDSQGSSSSFEGFESGSGQSGKDPTDYCDPDGSESQNSGYNIFDVLWKI